MSIRFWAALWISKFYRAGIRMVGKDGSCTPGQLALKICPDFLKELAKPARIIAVTGTNGKTTTSNLLTHVLRDAGYSVTNNSTGSNVVGGVAAALLADTTLFNKAKKDVAVLEVDERSSLLVYKHITPEFLMCNNVMRDSIKRNAHTDFIAYILNTALPASTHVILNADDFVCAGLFPNNTKRTYFGMTWNAPKDSPLRSRDVVYCPHCDGRLTAKYARWDHIGRIVCPTCGMMSPEPDYKLTEANEETFTVTRGEESITLKNCNINIVNLYNCTGAVALLKEFGITDEQSRAAFEKLTLVKSRFNIFRSDDLTVVMQMAKGQNPTATGRAYSFVASQPGTDKCVLVMNDDMFDNTHNSENICWFFDTDNSALKDPSVTSIVFGGPRCLDKKARAIMAGVDPAKIETYNSFDEAADRIDLAAHRNIFVLNDNLNADEAEAICKRLVKRDLAEKAKGEKA